MVCEKCEHTIDVGEWPFCPHGFGHGGIQGDDIPGGVMIEHAICHPDGTPKRYDTRSAIKKALDAGGWVPCEETRGVRRPDPKQVRQQRMDKALEGVIERKVSEYKSTHLWDD